MKAVANEGYSAGDSSPAAALLIEIVADGGAKLGFGHVGRCLALWEQLRGEAFFRVEDDLAAEFVRARGAVGGSCGAVTVGGAGGAIGAPREAAAPLLLIDRARPTEEAEVRALQCEGQRVVLLDDLGSGRAVADMVIDPPTCAAWPGAAGMRLAGFDHALLRREVIEAGAPTDGAILRTPPTHGERRTEVSAANAPRVLVAMGGSDPTGLTEPISEELRRSGVDAAIALGPGHRASRPPTGIVGPEPFPAALAGSALLITGYGHTLLEAAHLGVPAISVVSRPEHLVHARAFAREGTALMFDLTGPSRAANVAAAAAELLSDPGRRARMASRGRELVDGKGAARVAKALRALAVTTPGRSA